HPAPPDLPGGPLLDLHRQLLPGRRRGHPRLPPPRSAGPGRHPGPGRRGVPPGAAGVRVEVRGLSYAYTGEPVLGGGAGLSLEIREGQTIVVIGPSGSGKSTLLRLLAGLLVPTSGAVLFDGRDLVGVPTEKRDVGMVFQSYALFPHLTVRENIA